MKNSSYTVTAEPRILAHKDAGLPQLLGDRSEDAFREPNHVDAMAASGDCFITLATRLDKVAQGLPQDSSEQIELENLVKTLFYLQDNYDVVSKRKRHKD